MNRRTTILSFLLVLALIPCSVYGQAFKDSENDPLKFLRTLPRPNMLVIADTSGSMLYHINADKSVRMTSTSNGYNFDSDDLNSRIKNLKNAVAAVVSSVGKINFGLARFNNWTSSYNFIGSFNHTIVTARTIYKMCYQADASYSFDTSDCFWLTSNTSTVYKDNKRYGKQSSTSAAIGTTWTLYHYYTGWAASPYPGSTITHSYTYDSTTYSITYNMAYVNASGDNCQGLYMPTVSGLPSVTVNIRNDYLDSPLTPEDEADNLPEILKATGTWNTEGTIVPTSLTPLYGSLVDAETYFLTTIIPRDDSYPDIKACRKNYIVLITDGDETCDGSVTRFTTKARDLYNNDQIKTFAIALSLNDTTYVDDCADYGDDGVLNNSSTAYACNNTADLVEAFKDIVSKISDQMDSLAPPVVSTVYSHPYWNTDPSYAGNLDASEAILVLPFFQYPSWRGHLLATWLYYIEYNPRIPDDPVTPEDERWITYNFNPQDIWTAGYVFSWQNAPLADTNGDTYINEADALVANSGYKNADDRVIYTTNGNSGHLDLVPFTDSLPDKINRLGLLDADIPSVWLTAWNNDKARRQYQNDNELADTIINFIRGKMPEIDTADADGDGNLKDFKRDPYTSDLIYKERDWKLGDSVLSVPAIVSDPSGLMKKKFFGEEYILPGEQTFEDFTMDYVNRPNVVIYGASDGMLHCLALKDISTSESFGPSGAYSPPRNYIAGEEIWAFVPGDPDAMQKLKWLLLDYNGDGEIDGQIYQQRSSTWYPSDPNKTDWIHWYYMDGPVRFSNVFIDEDGDGIREWKTVAIIGEGRGGRYYYTLDLTNPFEPRLMWKFPGDDADSTNMGVTLSTPAIAYQAIPDGSGYRWLAIFGAGYDAADNSSTQVGKHIYAIDIADGSLIYDFNEPATESGSKKAMVIASPSVVNSQVGTDYIDDKAFVGDTDGRLWRINLNDETISKRLDFGSENQPIVAGVSAAHAYGESVWWDVIFVGTGSDTRITGSQRYRIAGFIDEAFNLPFIAADPTIYSGASDDMNLPSPILLTDPISSFTPNAHVLIHFQTDSNEFLDAQPATNVVESISESLLQVFFTLFNAGTNPCIIGTSRLVEIDIGIDKNLGTVSRTSLPSGLESGSLSLGEGKSGGVYISDGVVFAPAGKDLNMFGNPVPPPAPKGNKIVVNVLSWKVLTD